MYLSIVDADSEFVLHDREGFVQYGFPEISRI